jgi:hypothetical protein
VWQESIASVLRTSGNNDRNHETNPLRITEVSAEFPVRLQLSR